MFSEVIAMQNPLRHTTLYSIAIGFFFSPFLAREIDFSTCETGSLNL